MPKSDTDAADGERAYVDAEVDLRRDGQYVLFDSSQSRLWHFVLSGPEAARNPLTLQKIEQAAAIIARYHLRKTKSGSLRAADVAESTNMIAVAGDVEMKESMSNSKFASQTDSILAPGHVGGTRYFAPGSAQSGQENAHVYEKIILALNEAICYAVSATKTWHQISPGVFAPLIRQRLDDFSSKQHQEHVKVDWTRLCKLKATWLTSGSVIMKYKPLPVPESLKVYIDGELVDFDPVVLSPMGVIAYAMDDIHQNELSAQHQSEDSQWKEAVNKWLCRWGILLGMNSRWTFVRVVLTDEMKPGKEAPTTSFSWPVELCHNAPQSVKEFFEEAGDQPSPEPLRDLLAEAEAWFLNKDRRAEEVRIQLQKKKMEEDAAENDDSEIDDFIHLFPKTDGMLDVQAMTGIYPTPPDAPRPHGSGSADGRTEQQIIHSDAKTPATEVKTPKVTFEDPPDSERIDLDMETFDHIEEDDLFGNMQGGEYSNNGVTEDDFSFFDEPGDTPMGAGTQSSIVETPDNIQIQPTLLHNRGNIQIHEKAESLAIHDSPLGNSPLQSSHNSVGHKEESTPEQKPDAEPMEWQNTPQDLEEPPKATDPKTKSFENKYGQKGRFSTETLETHTTTPGHAPGIRNYIPSLSRPQDSNDSEYDSDDSDSSLEPSGRRPGIEIQDPQAREEDHSSTDASKDQGHVDDLEEIEAFYDSFSSNYYDFIEKLNRLPYTLMQLQSKGTSSMPLPTNLDLHVRLAQIFADQMIYYKDLTDTEPPPLSMSSPTGQDHGDPAAVAMRSLLPSGGRCSIEKLVHVGDDGTSTASAAKGPNRQPLKRSDTMKPETPSQPISPIHPPQVRTKRGDKQMEINWVALRFWEDLGLCPFAGEKNVVTFCIFPDQEVVRRGAKSFQTMMNSTYTSLRLGTHDAGHPAIKGYRDGLVAMPKPDENSEGTLERMCEKLGRSLQSLAAQQATIVLYMFNDRDKTTGTRSLCSAFLRLFESYASNLRFTSNSSPCDIVLKVLPLSWIASSTTIAMPQVRDLMRLSKEIYDRCPLDDESLSPYSSHSLIEIAQPVPKSLHFRLTSESHANPFQRETYAHVAYCWDEYSLWITAAMTDTLGCHSWSASFYIGAADKWAVFRVFVKEVLEIVEESIEDSHGRTRTVVYKDQCISQEEQTIWTSLAQDEALTLINLDPSPALYLLDEPAPPPTFDLNQIPSTIPSTPDVSSSDANTLKPGDEFDPEARAVDLDEEAWAVVTNRSQDVERNPDARDLVAHGYLIKRGHAVLSFRIAQAEREVDVRELLAINQGLICLAKARGLEGELPCHMAVARRAQDGLVFF